MRAMHEGDPDEWSGGALLLPKHTSGRILLRRRLDLPRTPASARTRGAEIGSDIGKAGLMTIPSLQPDSVEMDIVFHAVDGGSDIAERVPSVFGYAWPAYRPAGSLWPWGSATLGFALPAAIGAAVALGGRMPVVAACGDGGFLFTAMELATAVMQSLPVITLVHNDHGFRSIGYHQEREYGGRLIGTELVNPDIVAFARSFGAHAEQVGDIATLPAAVARAAAAQGPAVIEIIDPLGRPWS